MYCIIYTVYCVLYNIYCKLYPVDRKLFSPRGPIGNWTEKINFHQICGSRRGNRGGDIATDKLFSPVGIVAKCFNINSWRKKNNYLLIVFYTPQDFLFFIIKIINLVSCLHFHYYFEVNMLSSI